MIHAKRARKRRLSRSNTYVQQLSRKKEQKAIMGTPQMADYMVERHQDVLQNIEFTLIEGWRSDRSIDDSVVADALTAAIQNRTPARETVADLVSALDQMRQIREDVTDELWRNGLQTILQSVHRHSKLRPGQRDYLEFVSPYIL